VYSSQDQSIESNERMKSLNGRKKCGTMRLSLCRIVIQIQVV
jgi:hypothetical protein